MRPNGLRQDPGNKAQILLSHWFPSGLYYKAFPVCQRLSTHFFIIKLRINKRKGNTGTRVWTIGGVILMTFPFALLVLVNV